MPPDAYLSTWLRLSLVPGLGNTGLRKLLAAFGSPEGVLNASRSELARHVADSVAAAIREGAAEGDVDAALAWLEQPGNHVVTLADAAYPQLLLQMPDPPLLLYVKGRVELLSRPSLAIVGSRHATAQGLANAESFARAIADAGLTIVSGLALGVDAAAHRGGLAGAASTLAFLGTGIDLVYPARNRKLAHALAERGALVSEFPLGTKPLAGHFPRRNRLISGLSLGCLVIEAAAESGSLITARLAAEQGKDVFAIPGSIHSPLAKGCHALIKQGAKLVESAADVLEELRLPPLSVTAGGDASASSDARIDAVLNALGHDPCGMDALVTRSGLSAADLASLLTQLELEGRVEALAGGLYQRVHR